LSQLSPFSLACPIFFSSALVSRRSRSFLQICAKSVPLIRFRCSYPHTHIRVALWPTTTPMPGLARPLETKVLGIPQIRRHGLVYLLPILLQRQDSKPIVHDQELLKQDLPKTENHSTTNSQVGYGPRCMRHKRTITYTYNRR
jgi:hypothetical protein